MQVRLELVQVRLEPGVHPHGMVAPLLQPHAAASFFVCLFLAELHGLWDPSFSTRV